MLNCKEENMLTSKRILLSVSSLLIASLACVLPATTSTPDPNVINTAIAQTLAAMVSKAAPSLAPIIMATDTPSSTFTPTLTPTETVTPSPVFTATPLVPQISVSVATNCRVGPGKAYDRVSALLVGELAEVVGRDPSANYWLIRNPESGPEFCWLWGEFATLTGNFVNLPIFTPPPTPTPVPNFTASYGGKDTCVGWWVDIDLDNTGGVAFESVSLTLRDTVTNTVQSVYSNNFTDIDGCLDSETKENLNSGGMRTISSPAFAYDPAGHKLRATITLCSNNDNSGTCITQVITFTP